MLVTIHKNDLISYYTFGSLDKYGIVHGIFMRHGGCSPKPWKSLNLATSVGDSAKNVIENRKRISTALDIEHDSFFDVWQVHSCKTVTATKPRKIGENHIQADAILTHKNNISILMLFADCVPILFYDPVKEVIAAAHAGWQGTFKKVAAETVMAMKDEFDCKAQDIIAAIGPSICVNHYQVGENVIDAARSAINNCNQVISKNNKGYHVDLQKSNQLILEEAGVKHIEQAGICTMCHNQDWFSHRGENGKAGRFGAVITLKKQ